MVESEIQEHVTNGKKLVFNETSLQYINKN